MTIQRQYSLPNCKLVLEGLSDATAPADAARPLMSILVNAECHLAGHEKPLSGGREFLDGLVAAVSDYAQELLSGIRHPNDYAGKSAQVQLHRVSDHLHRLTVQPQVQPTHHTEAIAPAQIDLPTVQLFDLVEAIDQLFADTQTLPDLQRHLLPLAKRHVAADEPIAKRAAPVTLGLSSLAAAAALLFLIPVPEVERPEPTGTRPAEDAATASPIAAASPSPEAGASPPDPEAGASPVEASSPIAAASPAASPDAEAASPSPDGSPSPSPAGEGGGDPLEPAELDALLSRAPEIANANQVRALTLDLRDRLDRAWTRSPNFDDELVYRVGVAENGDILGFKYVNQASIDHVDKTPLLDLRYNPTDPAASPEPIVQMRVVFTPNGVVQVSPWNGYPQ